MSNTPPLRILLVEDDRELADLIGRGLRREGYAVDHAADGERGLSRAEADPYALLICDLMLPKLDGLSLIETLRRRGSRLPVLVLSAKTLVEERVEGLHAGADDYLTKPFAFDELNARVEALLRRSRVEPPAPEIRVENLRVDLLQGKVFRDESEIELQPQEFALLVFLMRNHGRVVTRSMIIEQVWHYNVDPLTNVVESRICRLRNKVDRSFSPKLIQTVRGYGYALRTME
ncbi:response regulator transcription factor [Pontiella sp.]|uniref:response regulator transcription factor n=1 Tax=Pontiella sp. TaxID=2837462 RepID=UPI003567D411